MTTSVPWKHWKMRNFGRMFLIALAGLACARAALADNEASNVPHVAAGPYGRCYAKSVPTHIYDPKGEQRQQGQTTLFRVGDVQDVVEHRFDWFSQKIILNCGPANDTVVVRIGPWHRGQDPSVDHLAIAFYKSGKLLKRYSTLDIAGGEKAMDDGLSKYRNVSVSVSHYTVFKAEPELVRVTTNDGPIFKENWVVKATTVDGRGFVFDMTNGELQ